MSVDWRADSARSLQGHKLQRRTWQRWTPEWDHDHCSGCGAKFTDHPQIPDGLREGYTTTSEDSRGAGYEWVCLTCFADLREEMGWIEVPPEEGPIVKRNPNEGDTAAVPGFRTVRKI